MIDLSACEALFDLRLGDLKSGEEFKGADILLLDEEKIRQCAIQFFSEGTIRNRAGHRPTSEEKYRFMCRMIEFGQHWRRNEFANHRKDVTCSPGWFSHCYMEREEHCYDGGSGGTDTVTRELIFSRVTKSRGELEAKLKEELTVWLRRWKEADKVIRQCKESWLYDGTLTDETIPVLLCGGRLYLMDPFGMQGIFCFTRGGRG